jgi:hypothetical protein
MYRDEVAQSRGKVRVFDKNAFRETFHEKRLQLSQKREVFSFVFPFCPNRKNVFRETAKNIIISRNNEKKHVL